MVKAGTNCEAKAGVFLDRDGVLNVPDFRNGRSYAPLSVDDFKLYPETKPALEKLKLLGVMLVVVTNQPDIANGKLKRAELEKMHKILCRELPVDLIEVCAHGRDEICDCRKPRTGMLINAAKELSINLSKSFMVGDRKSDIVVGENVGAKTVFIDHGYTNDPLPDSYDFSCFNIGEAATWICDQLRCSSAKK